MRLNEHWLREWVDPPLPIAAIGERLTMAGLEIETLEPLTAAFSGVVVARVVGVERHPDADRLTVCRVEHGTAQPADVVCGAPNVRPGMLTALALPGAKLPGAVVIRATRLRGVPSAGMLCSERELGLSDEAGGLIDLPGDAAPGTDLAEYLALRDTVLEVNVTPNRGDCLSVRGVARELALATHQPWREPATATTPALCADVFDVRLDAADACPVYAGRVLRGVDVNAPTPIWVRERLRRAGLRSISAVVDVTNYVMLELGQPLHAFDLGTLTGGIVVRYARGGEALTLLDGRELALDPDTLVICDHARVVGLAGIMGGSDTAVSNATSDVFLEGAFFAPAVVGARARALRLNTDAAHRFERGVAFDLQARAIERASALIVSICGGRAGPTRVASALDALPRRDEVRLRHDRLVRVIGRGVGAEEIERILAGLEFQFTRDAQGWRVRAPAFRFDIALEIDLVEEIARGIGYESVAPNVPRMALEVATASESEVAIEHLRAVLVERGYHEIISYSFVDAERMRAIEPQRAALALANPIAADMAVMRSGAWPGLLQALDFNRKRQRERVRVFELGPIFEAHPDRPRESTVLAGAAFGSPYPRQWGTVERPLDFFDLRGDIDALVTAAGAHARFRTGAHPALHPGVSAVIEIHGRACGYAGKLHPDLSAGLDLPADVYVFQIPLDALQRGRVRQYEVFSRQPTIRRDISMLVDSNQPAQALMASARELAGEWLADLELFDVYTGERIDSGKKSLAVGLIFQGSSSTLTDEEVDAAMDRVVQGLAERHGALLRT